MGLFMKKLKIFGYVILSLVLIVYISFLVIAPRVVNIDKYKPEIQKLVKDSTGLVLDYDKIDIITSPLLEAGIKTKDIRLKLPDGSVLFSAESFKGKVFLPSLLGLSIRVSCAELESPHLNIEIVNGENFKAAKVYEDLVNKKRRERRLRPSKFAIEKAQQSYFDVSKIKVFVPNLRLKNYKADICDLKTSHNLTLKGEDLRLGYYNGKFAKLKTEAEFLSDSAKNITLNVDLDTYIPKFTPQEQEEDDEAVFALPFINPVVVYRDYNLKSNIDTKLKIRNSEEDNKIWAKGYLNIDRTTVTMSGLQLPESFFSLKAMGNAVEFDTNFYVTDKEYLNFFGAVNYGKKPYVDFSLKSPQVHFANFLKITKAYLDTIHIRNDIEHMSASGYLLSNFHVKTDFSQIESNGKFIIREGNIFVRNIGLLFNNINANVLFDDNVFKIEDAHVLINKRPLYLSGKIDSNSIANVNITADRIPVPELYLAFAPRDIKHRYLLKSGYLTLATKVTGEIKDIAAMFKVDLENLVLSDRVGNFIISNDLFRLGVANIAGDIHGKLKNEGFRFNIPSTGSVIFNNLLIADINNDRILFDKSNIGLNRKSIVVLSGKISDYISNPDVKFILDGVLADSDLKILAGEQLTPYLDSRGAIPIKVDFNSKGKKMKLLAQLKSDPGSYITPVSINDFVGKQLLVQFLAEKTGDTLNIYKTGLYLRKANSYFGDNLRRNILNARQVVGIRAMVSNLSTDPFINLFKVIIPKELSGSICAFKNSRFNAGGQLSMYGRMDAPHINGTFNVRNLNIPELLTSVRHVLISLGSNDVRINLYDINANGSDFNVNIYSTWDQFFNKRLGDIKVMSRNINLDRLMQVSDAVAKNLPSPAERVASTQLADVPVEILRGSINLRRITTGNILVRNTTGRISLFNNILYVNNLRTIPMEGIVIGDASVNLVSTLVNAKLRGREFDVAKVMLDAMGMNDTLAGKLDFIADISFRGASTGEQMSSLRGFVDFNVKDGQLGPFGKFENFLMAENIRENAFFSSAVGSVITNIMTIDTSHFNSLYGHLTFKDGFAQVSPIKSRGNVMSMYIAGKVGLVDNSADLKVRGKLASTFSDSLGPLADINPINLVKNTPGVNIVAAKSFSIFCESVSEEEMNALPELGEGKSDDYATKFQIGLHGDTRKPLKMIKSFKWLALDSEIQSAVDFVDTIPTPEPGEENLTVEELIELRSQQDARTPIQEIKPVIDENDGDNSKERLIDKIRSKINKYNTEDKDDK